MNFVSLESKVIPNEDSGFTKKRTHPSPDHKTHYPKLINLLQSPKTKDFDCLRLGLLYVLRYEKDKGNAKEEVRRLLQAKGVSPSQPFSTLS